MSKFVDYFSKTPFLLLDQGCLTKKDYFSPFAYTDVLLEYVGEQNNPILHFWQLDQAMILGMKDTRVTNLDKGLDSLIQHGYTPIVRNSGGLGVIADTGILNISLIFQNSQEQKISIDTAYEWMWQWIQLSFPEKSQEILAFEIHDSYCPGSFDLSIHGKKFAGIAQRRIKNGIAVMIYLSVTGDQFYRGTCVKEFYEAGLKGHLKTNEYPLIHPSSMANLSDLLQLPLSISTVKKRLLTVLYTKLDSTVEIDSLKKETQQPWFSSNYEKQLLKMQKRNEIIQKELA